MSRDVLATDLDGTLIPLEEESENSKDLFKLGNLITERSASLVFVTGRHFSSVMNAIAQYSLPTPDWILCDVGTSILQRNASYDEGSHNGFRLTEAYHSHLAQIVDGFEHSILQDRIPPTEGLRLQEQEKQGPYKLSYYADATLLDELVDDLQSRLRDWNAPWSIISSVDPFNGDGLVDLLPKTVSKAHALDWWANHAGLPSESIVFAGDSGNDHAALTAGYKSIVVGNADRRLAESVAAAHKQQGWDGRLYLASRSATSGVLEGCQNYWCSSNTTG